MYFRTPRSRIKSSQSRSVGQRPGRTVFLPLVRAQYAAPPIISLKMFHCGSIRESHSLRLFGSFHNSTQSKNSPKRVIITSMKSAYALGVWGGEENFGTTPSDGGVYRKHGRMLTSFARRGKSHAYQPSPSDVYQSAQQTRVRKSCTPKARKS